MSATHGAITLPVGETTPAGDPALAKIGAFLRAAINAECNAAFTALKLAADMPAEATVDTVFTIDPRRYAFDDRALPALFVYRDDSAHRWDDQDRRVEECDIKVMYLFPHDPYHQVPDRVPFANAIAKATDVAVTAGRHSAWLDDGDVEPFSAAIVEDLDSIKTSIATSTSAQTYSGAALNGIIGGATMLPRREPTITTTATAGAYNAASPAVLTFIDWTNTQRTANFMLAANGGQTLRLGHDVKSVVSWALPAQSNTSGSFQFGTSANASAGRGSLILSRCNLQRLEMTNSKRTSLPIEVISQDAERMEIRQYDAIEIKLSMVEEFKADLSGPPNYPINTLPHGLDLDVNQAGFTSSATLPS